MKFTGAILMVMLAANAFAGSEQIIKQHAKDLRDQNNARQGVPPPGAHPAPAAPVQQPPPAVAPTVIMMTPQQQAMAKLQAALAAIRPGAKLTSEHKQQLAAALVGVATGTQKPTPAAIAALSDSLTVALAEKLLSDVTRKRLMLNLAAVLNPGTMGASQMNDTISDVKSVFEANAGNKAQAEGVAKDLKLIAGQTQKLAQK